MNEAHRIVAKNGFAIPYSKHPEYKQHYYRVLGVPMRVNFVVLSHYNYHNTDDKQK